MARIRTTKPELWSNEDLSSLPDVVHLLAAALLNYADDYGYFNANPGLIKAGTFPLRQDITLRSIPGLLQQLKDIRFLRIEQRTDGKRYGQIAGFENYFVWSERR